MSAAVDDSTRKNTDKCCMHLLASLSNQLRTTGLGYGCVVVHISISSEFYLKYSQTNKKKHQRNVALVHSEREHQATVQPPPEREGICNN